MDNLIKNVIIDILVVIFLIVLAIVTIIKNHKDLKYILVIIGCLLVVFIVLLANSFFVYKDMIYKETIEFEGVCVSRDFSIYNLPIGTSVMYFDTNNDGQEDNWFLKSGGKKYVPEEGKKYRVVVYKYSHTIYSLEVVENLNEKV